LRWWRWGTVPAKPKTQSTTKTARDLGVPAEYLGPGGKFRPGADARLKSDLILRALDQPAPNALVPFSRQAAIKLLAKFPQWKPALDRKKQARAAATAKSGGKPKRAAKAKAATA
jgi:hypothetical protein